LNTSHLSSVLVNGFSNLAFVLFKRLLNFLDDT
jgi:hypothetical protein